MLRVEAFATNPKFVKVTPLTYWDGYKDLKRVPGARLDREERPGQKDLWYWTVPIASLKALESIFPDDVASVVYMTPRWQLTGDRPPALPEYMIRVNNRPVPGFKPGVQLFPYQQYGANFMVERARYNLSTRGRGYAFLCDDMGLGKARRLSVL